jgi:hypothetical protein
MTIKKTRNLLDFIPLVILTVSAGILVLKVVKGEYGFLWKHYAGLIVLPINYLLFFWRHKAGVLGLGVILILGLLSILSFYPAVTTTSIYKEVGNTKLPLFYGQLIFLLWIIIHFILSGRHYTGIVTKRYWVALKNNTEVRFD